MSQQSQIDQWQETVAILMQGMNTLQAKFEALVQEKDKEIAELKEIIKTKDTEIERQRQIIRNFRKRSIKPWQVRRLAVTPYGMPPASLDSKAEAYSSPADSWASGTSYPKDTLSNRTPAVH